MNYQLIADLNDIHRRELAREVEADRLAWIAQGDTRSRNYRLAALGHQMVEIGQRLQAQAGETEPQVALQP